MPSINPTQLSSLLQTCINNRLTLPAKSIHAQMIKITLLSSNTFLFNRLIEFYSQTTETRYALNTFDYIQQPNIFSWNAILSTLCKSNNIHDACKLFDRMQERNVVSWNTIIGGLSKSGYEKEGLETYYRMISQGFMPTHFTFASVLSACGSLKAVEDGTKCHGFVLKVGLETNTFVENSIVGMYVNCGRVEDAVKLFDSMFNPNVVSFTTMMGCFISNGLVQGSICLFVKMHGKGIHVDPVAVSSILSACARVIDDQRIDFDDCLSFGQSIQALVFKKRFEADPHVGNSLIDMYAKKGHMGMAEQIFDLLPVINVVSWNVLIAGYGQIGQGKKGMEKIELMQELGFEPDDVTYISLLGACTKSNDIETAREVFNKISSPSVLSWNAILSGYCQEKMHDKTVEMFIKMQNQQVLPDRTTLAVILSSCSGLGSLKLGKQVHAKSVRSTLHDDTFVASGLVDMYSKCAQIDSARLVFNRMKERDTVSWNSMITGFSLHSLNKEAFEFFKLMQEDGMTPTEFTYASVINSCARLCSLSQGMQIHAQIAKNGYDSNLHVGCALIDTYFKCGSVNDAQKFFDCMEEKNVVSWNEMIHGYAQNGLGEQALALFDHMLSVEEKPDAVTFIAVLTACSHSGLVDEGIKFLKTMEEEYGIEPLVDHYTCVIDALGRAGRLKEAEEIVDSMKYKDDTIVWEVLLSACAQHSDEKLGRRAAEVLFRVDPNNPAAYVLLSNIHAGLGKWKDALNVRAMMNDRGVVKGRGYSWNDQNDGLRPHLVDDGEFGLSRQLIL